MPSAASTFARPRVGVAPTGISIAPNPAIECDVAHICRDCARIACTCGRNLRRDAAARQPSFALRDWCPLRDRVGEHAFAQYALACDDRHLQQLPPTKKPAGFSRRALISCRWKA